MAQATLNGFLTDDGGAPCTVWFEWGTTDEYGKVTPYVHNIITGMGFSYVLTGLSDRTVYHYRSVAHNDHFVAYGADVAFVTPEGEHMMTLVQDEFILLIERGG